MSVYVCATKARVVRDVRRPVPYSVAGCLAGAELDERPDRIYIVGHTFVTEVMRSDVAEVFGHDPPDPCPHCGFTREPAPSDEGGE